MNLDRYLIVGGLLLIVVVLCFFIPPFYAGMLIPAIVVGVLLMGNPRRFLFIFLIVMSIHPLLTVTLSSGPIRYLNELMGGVLYALLFGHLAMRKLNLEPIKKLIPAFVAIGIWFLLTFLLNRSPIKPALQTVFSYFSFIPFFILSVNFLKRSDFRLIILGSIGFFWVNFALNCAWQLGINPLPNFAVTIWQQTGGHSSGFIDYATGTLGGCNLIAYFCIMLLFLLFVLKQVKLKLFTKRDDRVINITIVALFIQLYLTYTNHAYIIFILAFIPFAMGVGLWRKWQAVAGIIVGIIVVVIAVSVSEQLQFNFSKEQIIYRKETLVYSAKVQLFNDLLVENAKDNLGEWLIGVGPGNGMGTIGKDNLTPFALRMLLPYYQSTEMTKMQMSSVSGNTISAILTLWSDFGIVGFLLFFSVYVKLFFISVHSMMKRDDRIREIISKAFVGILPFFLIINIIFEIISMPFFVCWIWVLAAFLFIPIVPENEKGIR